MGLRFPAQKYGQCFFVTTTFKEWEKLGNIKGFYKELLKSINFCLKKYSAKMIGYVFMPSHIHLIVLIEGNNLGSFMRDFKKYVSQKIAADFGIKGGIWMPRYDRVVIQSDDVLRQKLEYIHMNPVKGDLVKSPDYWIWSSAMDYLTDNNSDIDIYKEWM